MAADVHVLRRLALTVIVLLIPTIVSDDSSYSLYSKDDEVLLLDVNNFFKIVPGTDNAWFVEFFSSWCGHCIRFAPKWKQLARQLSVWAPVIQTAAIDCALPENLPVCRDYNIEGYPTLRFIRANSVDKDLGVDYMGDRDIESLQHGMIDFLQNVSRTEGRPRLLPKLEPLRNLDEIWKDVTQSTKYTVVIFEETKSYLGREVILDVHSHTNLVIRRMTDGDKYAIKNYPAMFLIKTGGSFKQLTHQTDRASFVTALVELLGIRNTWSKAKDVSLTRGHQRSLEVSAGSPVHVYMNDLESAVHYSLKQEVARYQVISGERLDALKCYVIVLAKYFPGTESSVNYLKLVAAWLQNEKGPLSGSQWVEHINAIQTNAVYLPSKIDWVGCHGSTPRYRGYPCGLWTLFHTLSVNAVLDNNDMEDYEPQEVVLAMRGYINHFFGCRECSDNFMKMAVTIEKEVKESDDAILWLWRSHNKANLRLHSDETEDPIHPKVQFPDQSLCQDCQKNLHGQTSFDNKKVLNFLKRYYSRNHIVKNEDPPKAKASTVHELILRKQDWNQFAKKRAQKHHQALQQYEGAVKDWRDRNRIKLRERFSAVEMKGRTRARVSQSWGLNSVDISMCVVFYIICGGIIVLMYYIFNFHRTKICHRSIL